MASERHATTVRTSAMAWAQESQPTDLMTRLGSALFFVGCLTLPMGVLRIGPFTLSDFIFPLAAACAVLSIERIHLPALPSVQLAVFLLLFGITLSTTQSIDVADALSVGLRIFYLWTIWLWSARMLLRTPEQIERAIQYFLIGASLSALAALGQVAFGMEVPGSELTHGRASGLQFHPNGQGGLLAVALSFCFAFLLHGTRRGLNAIIFVIGIVGLLLSGSVSGVLGTLIGIGVSIVRTRISLRTLIAGAAILFILWQTVVNLPGLIPGSVSIIERFVDTTGQGEGESTLQSRLDSDYYAIAKISENPVLGYGLDSTSAVTYNGETITHNMFLLSWVQGGIFTFASFIIMVGTSLAKLRLRSMTAAAEIHAVMLPPVVAVLAFALTGPVFYERWAWFPLVMNIAVYTCVVSPGENESYRRQRAAHDYKTGAQHVTPSPVSRRSI